MTGRWDFARLINRSYKIHSGNLLNIILANMQRFLYTLIDLFFDRSGIEIIKVS